MDDDRISVLLVEDDPADARLILEAFSGAAGERFRVERVGLIPDALDRLTRGGVAVVLLGLEFGVETVHRIVAAAPDAIVLVLGTEKNDDIDARLCLHHGAYDYLARGSFDASGLPQFLGYVIREKSARDAQKIAEKRFQATSEASSLGICITDTQGFCLYTNVAYHRISGTPLKKIVGTHWSSVVHPRDRQRALSEWRKGIQKQAPFEIELRYVRKGKRIVWVRAKVVGMRDERQIHGYVQTLEDITEQKIREFVLRATEDALFDEMELVQATLNSINDAVMTVDIHGKVIYMNRAAEEMTGWPRKKALGLSVAHVLQIVDSSTRKMADNPLLRAIQENRTVRLAANRTLVARHGAQFAIADSSAPIHNAEGDVTGAVVIFHDAGESQAMTEKMGHLSQFDFLTGLPNRLLLTDRLTHAIEVVRRQGRQAALLYMEVDHFKHIGDSLGNAIRDQLLQSVAIRLVACVRSMDTVCRPGGSEFAVLLAEIEHPQDAIHIAEKVLAKIAVPHIVDAHVLHVSLSIGIGIYPDDGEDAASIVQNADTAMHHARAHGGNNFQFFKTEMNARAIQRKNVERGLRRALKDEEFVLHYQPIIDFATGNVTGAEALLRWRDPANGLVLPARFMQIAEESGLIVPIGQWVLREACRQVQTWLDAGLRVVPVAVNISAVEFRNDRFLDGLTMILQETGVAPRYLELDLNENVLMRNADASVATLKKLRAMGLALAIDNFGTGNSSLSHLRRFPVNALKIDPSFVSDIGSSIDDMSMLNAVIALGQNLKQQVVAEGVETGEQFSILQAQHCNEGQGFHFSPPLPADEFSLLLQPG